MPPSSKRLKGQIASGLSECACFRPYVRHAYHILRIVHAKDLFFHKWIYHPKIFFWSKLSLFSELMPFGNIRNI